MPEKELYQYVGQELPSMDCGYFAGYVIQLWDKHGPHSPQSMMMSREEVYRARNISLNPATPDKPSGKLTGGNALANGMAMVTYLASMKCYGYQADWTNPNPLMSAEGVRDRESIRTILHQHMPLQPSRDAVALAIGGPTSGHWVSLLNTGNRHYIYYDPGRPRRPYADANIKEEQVLNKLIHKGGIYRIVWSHIELEPIGTKHTVASGESLSIIARRYWNDVLLWPLIYDANKGEIGPNWNQIKVNQLLTIPDIKKFTPAELNAARQRGRTG